MRFEMNLRQLLLSIWPNTQPRKIAGCVMVGILTVFMLYSCSRDSNHLYKFENGIIDIRNVKVIQTGMSFELRERYGGLLFSIGPDAPITDVTISKVKKAIAKTKSDSAKAWGETKHITASAYVEFDGRKMPLKRVGDISTRYQVERILDDWLKTVDSINKKVR